jgi:hypothetical protein
MVSDLSKVDVILHPEYILLPKKGIFYLRFKQSFDVIGQNICTFVIVLFINTILVENAL